MPALALPEAGGLGSNAALMLARCGVGHITLVDDDVVDASNLNRQQYWPRHAGRHKVDALRELLLELNPHMDVATHKLHVTADNLPALLPACPIWIEADGPNDKSLFVEGALLAGRRVASASGMGGCGSAPMGRRNLGALVLVGDFTTDILMAPPWPPRHRSRRPAGRRRAGNGFGLAPPRQPTTTNIKAVPANCSQWISFAEQPFF